jgi:Cadmium carbonic anhydrase repeat
MQKGHEKNLELLVYPDSQTAYQFFKKNGWAVEYSGKSELVPADNVLGCGDGRYANLSSLFRKNIKGIFGGVWGVAALKTGGDMRGIEKAVNLIQSKDMMPTFHGDEHGYLSCGFFNLWKQHLLTPHTRPYSLDLTDQQLEGTVGKLALTHTLLPGAHEEEKLVMSFIPGLTPALDPKTFRLNGELPKEFGIDFMKYLEVSALTISLLTKSRLTGPVKTVRIIV